MQKLAKLAIALAAITLIATAVGCNNSESDVHPIAGMGTPGQPPPTVNGVKVDASGRAIGAGPDEAMKAHGIQPKGN